METFWEWEDKEMKPIKRSAMEGNQTSFEGNEKGWNDQQYQKAAVDKTKRSDLATIHR